MIYFCLKWNKFTRNCEFYFHLFRVPGKKLTISCEFGLHNVKLQYMFSSMKIEEYIEYELSGIFRVKLIAKNMTDLLV